MTPRLQKNSSPSHEAPSSSSAPWTTQNSTSGKPSSQKNTDPQVATHPRAEHFNSPQASGATPSLDSAPKSTPTNDSRPLRMKRLPRAVLFDYDGVLVASEPIHLSAWMQLLDELHLPRNLELIQSMIGKTAPEIIRQILLQHRPEHNPSLDELQHLAQRKNEIYIASMDKQLVTFPGVFEGLQWLKSNQVKTAVVSNARRNELHKTMIHLKLTPFFDEIISREDAGVAKPDPTPYLMGANSLGVPTEHCVAIEDSPTGLEAALRAEIPAAAVLTSYSRQEVEMPIPELPHLKPHWIGPSIQDFFDWLKTLER